MRVSFKNKNKILVISKSWKNQITVGKKLSICKKIVNLEVENLSQKESSPGEVGGWMGEGK